MVAKGLIMVKAAILSMVTLLGFGVTVDTSTPKPLYGTKAAIEATDFCKKYRCKLEQKGSLDRINGSYREFSITPVNLQSEPEDERERLSIQYDKEGRIIGFQLDYNPARFGAIVSYYEAELSIDLIRIMIGLRYKNAPHGMDDINNKCLLVSRERSYNVMAQGKITPVGSQKPISYALYCVVFPSDRYPFRRVQDVPDAMIQRPGQRGKPGLESMEVLPTLRLNDRVYAP